ncbi:hypothetical protein PspLS_10946 [Pyricularia sp. CBS 133598]|nr:hypothetical protein PspLS_10946 [Pyricularia sp. CBS 133598]
MAEPALKKKSSAFDESGLTLIYFSRLEFQSKFVHPAKSGGTPLLVDKVIFVLLKGTKGPPMRAYILVNSKLASNPIYGFGGANY